MEQTLNAEFQELDTVILTHDILEQGLKQGDMGAIVHCYSDSAAYEVEFVNPDGETIALLTLTRNDIKSFNPDSLNPQPQPMSNNNVNMNFNAPVYGAAGNVEGDQIINADSQNLDQAVTEIAQIFRTLQQQHPAATEVEAHDIIEAEFEEIRIAQPNKWQVFRQDLLNRERWFNGGKAALTETTKHYVDNSVLLKAGIAFLEGFSAEEP